MELYLGIALMVLGVVLLFIGRPPKSKSKSIHVQASGGSVAVGGVNKGSIANVNLGSPSPAPHGHKWLTVLAIVVEVIGMAVVLWHAWHMASAK